MDEESSYICLYVDDMLIFGTNTEVVKDTKKFLSSKFSIKDMGLGDQDSEDIKGFCLDIVSLY